MSAHSVKSHLGVAATAYDDAIRRFVPHYEEMLTEAVALVATLAPRRARLLDLGAGTGALSAALLRGLPEATVTLLDVDPAMLDQAKDRLGAAGGRATFHRASFFEPLPSADAVVASLSLHHVPELAAKTALYRGIHAALPAGGLFLSLDAAVTADPVLAARSYADWIAWMKGCGIAVADAERHLADWANEDFYQPLAAELAALAAAGFAHPECFWRRGPMAIFGALKA